MDVKDKKILYELDKDARASYAHIAKSTKLSQETVRYRVNSLVKEGVIQKFLTIINTTLLGNSYYQLMLKLQHVTEQKKNQILQYLEQHPQVAWIGNLEGNYDIAVIIYVQNQRELQQLIEELYEQHLQYIMRKTVSIHLYAEFFTRDYLVGKERVVVQKKHYQTHKNTLTLDQIDNKICSLLGTDARTSAVELARNARVSVETILQRMKKLKKNSVILGHTIVLKQEKLGQLHYKLLLYVNNLTREKERAIFSFSAMNNRVISIVKTLAEWNYEIDLEVERIEQVKQFTMSLTSEFSDAIRDYDLVRIVDMPKYTFFP